MNVPVKYMTEDGCIVNQFDPVWEIRYEWLNWEFSRAYTTRVRIADLPEGTKVWKDKFNALWEVFRLNQPKHETWII